MPKYRFLCEKCGAEKQIYVSASTKQCQCECGSQMDRQLPNIRGTQVNELHDKYTNKSLIQDHKEIVSERKLDFYWSVEVPKMVNSGTYSLDTMLEKNWVYYNEKGDLVTRTKPPEKS